MKNEEKYSKEIVDIACNGNSIAVVRSTGELVPCCETSCRECLFNTGTSSCKDETRKWADSEYVERPVISKSDRTFLDYIRDEDKYIARDANGKLFTYKSKPCRLGYFNSWGEEGICAGLYLKCNVDFPMIKWGDDDPWLIEDLKKLEVVDEY